MATDFAENSVRIEMDPPPQLTLLDFCVGRPGSALDENAAPAAYGDPVSIVREVQRWSEKPELLNGYGRRPQRKVRTRRLCVIDVGRSCPRSVWRASTAGSS